jgi:hypothetical protein
MSLTIGNFWTMLGWSTAESVVMVAGDGQALGDGDSPVSRSHSSRQGQFPASESPAPARAGHRSRRQARPR